VAWLASDHGWVVVLFRPGSSERPRWARFWGNRKLETVTLSGAPSTPGNLLALLRELSNGPEAYRNCYGKADTKNEPTRNKYFVKSKKGVDNRYTFNESNSSSVYFFLQEALVPPEDKIVRSQYYFGDTRGLREICSCSPLFSLSHSPASNRSSFFLLVRVPLFTRHGSRQTPGSSFFLSQCSEVRIHTFLYTPLFLFSFPPSLFNFFLFWVATPLVG